MGQLSGHYVRGTEGLDVDELGSSRVSGNRTAPDFSGILLSLLRKALVSTP